VFSGAREVASIGHVLLCLGDEGENFACLRPSAVMTNDDASTILVVEDDDATRTFLADNLSADGYDLLVADCATDALGLLERKFPDLALVDLNLPDASGFELLRRVRQADGVVSRVDPDTPLLVLSGRTSELDRVRGFDRGADDYVCKRIASLFARASSAGRPIPIRGNGKCSGSSRSAPSR
jgi:CheY-like chemotaxis protein